jgi:Cu/Ag efflux pump CusA
MLSGTRASIAIKLFGPDLYELRRLAAQIEAVAQQIEGTVDVAVEAQRGDEVLAQARDLGAVQTHDEWESLEAEL